MSAGGWWPYVPYLKQKLQGTTVTAINAADNGPETSRVAIKAVVKDAAGNLLAGVPVVLVLVPITSVEAAP